MFTRKNVLTAFLATVLTIGLAACGGGSDQTEDTGGSDSSALEMARMAAAAAARAARTAATDARTASDSVAARDDATDAQKMAADMAADEAEAAAAVAENASSRAAETMDAATAKAAQDTAEAERTAAMTAGGTAAGILGEVTALADAKSDADKAATAAETAATEAEADAARVAELTGGADFEQAMAANTAAMASRTAATAAREASDMAQDATEASVAQGHQMTAETRKGTAESEGAKAEELRRVAQISEDVGNTQQEARDLAAAQKDAKMYADAAKGHYDAAKGKAADASAQATRARTAANRAMRGRTDYANADKHADDAELASRQAAAARTRAMTANTNAQTAYMSAMNATTSDDAEKYRDAAKNANDVATENHTGTTGAGMAYMRAEAAAADAEKYAGMHVLSLLKTANAYDVTTAVTGLTLDETKQREVDSIGAAITDAAEATTAAARRGTGTTATSTWPADTPDDPDTPDENEFVAGMLGITVNAGGTSIVAAFEAVAADPDADPAVDAVVQTAKMIRGLDDTFTHGFDIWEDDGNAATTTDAARVIAFSNKQQGTPAVTEVTFVSGRELTRDAVTDNTVTDLGTKVGNTYRGVTYFEGDTTDDEGTAFTGTLTCPDEAACAVETAENGDITVTGYVFTGSRPERAAIAEAPAADNNDYLVLGIWLDEEAGDGTDSFGAFAVGPDDYDASVGNVITGTATYRGSAFGAHHITGGPVSFFDGKATLTADFGNATGEPGSIKGTINDIHVGGTAYGRNITLSTNMLSEDSATFENGRAVMGPQKEPGSQEHLFNGTWDGSFYGASEAIEDDPDTTANEAVAAGARAPGAVAGTFGVTRSETMGTGADAMTTVESFVGAYGADQD